MRVIAGIAKGTKLYNPSGMSIRPTLDRVRTSLFDIIGPAIEGKLFLDLFAGTGANGIEALSRGAKKAWFVDNSTQALQLIERNLRKTRLIDKAVIIKATLPYELTALPEEVDYIFADPPYSFNLWLPLVNRLIGSHIITIQSLIICEHSKENTPPDSIDNVSLVRRERYGDTFLSFYSIKE